MKYDGILVILGTQFWFLNKAPIMKDNLSKCPETDFPILDRSILFSSESQYDAIIQRVSSYFVLAQ